MPLYNFGLGGAGSGGGTTSLVLLGEATLMTPLEAELVTTTLEASLEETVLESVLFEPLEAEVE